MRDSAVSVCSTVAGQNVCFSWGGGGGGQLDLAKPRGGPGRKNPDIAANASNFKN